MHLSFFAPFSRRVLSAE